MTSFQTYQVIPLPKDNNYDFIFETGGNTMNGEAKKLPRAKANQPIWGLTNFPFPPNLTLDDLIKPRNARCGKMKVPNKFFVYRKWYSLCLADSGRKNVQASISPLISENWHNEPEFVKSYYGELSKRADKLFKKRYGKNGIERTPGKYK
ncbi:7151_t:CDS:1 [Diversispora eburnea]|uniref:7151_t:CDS:1 n=1 Tax=Diversispora eburnea TaxID=1213867 RepID=A0A9N8V4A7_9GLOM|nr:7151_t:CDS:1 [Diversispora eburnea]